MVYFCFQVPEGVSKCRLLQRVGIMDAKWDRSACMLNLMWKVQTTCHIDCFHISWEWITARACPCHSRIPTFMLRCRSAAWTTHGKSVLAVGRRTSDSFHKWMVSAEQFLVKGGNFKHLHKCSAGCLPPLTFKIFLFLPEILSFLKIFTWLCILLSNLEMDNTELILKSWLVQDISVTSKIVLNWVASEQIF